MGPYHRSRARDGARENTMGKTRGQLVGIGIAFLLEWLYGKRPAP